MERTGFARVSAGLLLLMLAHCGGAPQTVQALPPPDPPAPPHPEADRSALNAKAVFTMLHKDPGWIALLKAADQSNAAFNALSDASSDDIRTDNEKYYKLVLKARDAYRAAMSFQPAPIEIRSSCNGSTNEVVGSVKINDGLKVLYANFLSRDESNLFGVSCYDDVGGVSEIVSSRGLPIGRFYGPHFTFDPPFLYISTGNQTSMTDLVNEIR